MALGLAFPAQARAAAVPRPNVIFILIDDLGYGDLGCYGNSKARTPNIDRLADKGVRFTQFYVNAPICSPSRVALTTGQYPGRHRIGSFIASRGENKRRGMNHWLGTDAPTLARLLQASGYRTAHIGKWHMGGGRDVGEAPLISEYGFDHSLTQFEGLGDRLLCTFDTLFPNQPNRAHPLANDSAKLGRGKVEFVKRAEITPRFVEASIEFVRASRDAKQPFYLNLWPDDVHSPHEPSPASRRDGSKEAMYRGVVEELDTALAPLLDLVRSDEQLKRNTLIILASDNGHDADTHNAAGLRGNKGTLYEGGIRAPLIVWWPGGQAGAATGAPPGAQGASRAKSVNDRSVIAGFDLPPTVLSLANVQTPVGVSFDGMERADAFKGVAPEKPRGSPIFWVRPPDRPGLGGMLPDLAVRDGRWKLLIEADGSRAELFDVVADPNEKSNLADSHGEVVKDLSAKLEQWRQSMPQPLLPATAPPAPAKTPRIGELIPDLQSQ
ncbi:MAG: sulfatase-like hydrolase/transferase [Tepidisphaeraceae bacterium]